MIKFIFLFILLALLFSVAIFAIKYLIVFVASALLGFIVLDAIKKIGS